MKYLLLSAFLVSSVAFSKTYDFSNRFGIGANGGYTFPIQGNEFDDTANDEMMWGLHARYNLTAKDALQLNFSQYEFENTDINARVYDLMYLSRFKRGDKFTPFWGLGAGVADMDNIQPFKDSLKFAGRARAGIEYALTDDFVASLFADYQFVGKMPFNSEDEDDDDESFPGREIFAIVPQIGLTYFFGPDKEIEGEKKAPPAEPTAAPATTATAAAPATVAAAPVDSSQLDDDKDGIKNLDDKCPGTRPGNMVNSYGCMQEEKASMRLEVLFPTGQKELNDEANPHLNSLAKFMNEHPDTKLEIQGHTDNVGSDKVNKQISEARANAVKEYLVEEAGIQPTRISAYGYGERKPIRENTTPEGRAENRRVIGVISQ